MTAIAATTAPASAAAHSRGSRQLALVPPDDHGAQASRLPDPRPLTRRLAQAIAEVLAGARPASQLSSHATHHVIRQLERNAAQRTPRVGAPQRRPLIDSLHLGEPCEGVIEACAVIDTGSRKRALALRLEGAGSQWRCTAVNSG
jgi:Family of unknown function (DUF6459)